MWTKVLGFVLKALKKVSMEVHWKGGDADELRIVIGWNGRILFDRTFDVIRD